MTLEELLTMQVSLENARVRLQHEIFELNAILEGNKAAAELIQREIQAMKSDQVINRNIKNL